MRIGIIGATGKAGRAIYKEAQKRNHKAVAIVRNEKKAKELFETEDEYIIKDAFDLTIRDLETFDVIVNAFATTPDKAYLHVDLATKLINMFRNNKNTRLIFLLGAASLTTGEDQHLFLEDIKKMPDSQSWISIPINQLEELNFLKGINNVNWTGVSPSAVFGPGPAAGVNLGINELMTNDQGEPKTSTGTMALAILDEIEVPKHLGQRFSVANKF